jgi:SpoVK/Ycf46/Vps4 family AAA+-type ATPase
MSLEDIAVDVTCVCIPQACTHVYVRACVPVRMYAPVCEVWLARAMRILDASHIIIWQHTNGRIWSFSIAHNGHRLGRQNVPRWCSMTSTCCSVRAPALPTESVGDVTVALPIFGDVLALTVTWVWLNFPIAVVQRSHLQVLCSPLYGCKSCARLSMVASRVLASPWLQVLCSPLHGCKFRNLRKVIPSLRWKWVWIHNLSGHLVTTQLLIELDNIPDGVVVVATTNSPELVDGALLRAGRLDQ